MAHRWTAAQKAKLSRVMRDKHAARKIAASASKNLAEMEIPPAFKSWAFDFAVKRLAEQKAERAYFFHVWPELRNHPAAQDE